MVAANPGDRGSVGLLSQQPAASPANRIIGIVVDFAPGDRGNILIKQTGQRADNPRFGLATLAQQNHMMASQDSVFDFGQNRLIVTDDPRYHFFLGTQPDQQ